MFKRIMRGLGLLQDEVGLRGDVELVLWDENGKLKDYRFYENVVTNLGCAFVADAMSDIGKNIMKYMAVGKATQAQTGGATALASQVGARGLVAGSKATQGTGANDHKFSYKETFAAGGHTGGLKEAGIFNATAAGTMLCYLTYSVINKGTADTLTITWTLAVSDN